MMGKPWGLGDAAYERRSTVYAIGWTELQFSFPQRVKNGHGFETSSETDVIMSGWFISIETTRPPQPVPLTIGCMPVLPDTLLVKVAMEYVRDFPNTRLTTVCVFSTMVRKINTKSTFISITEEGL
jgi:hypothetical protein